MPDENRRRSERTRMPALATITTMSGSSVNDQAVGTVVDVSRHGVRLRTGQPPPVGTWVRMRFAIGDQFHTIEGVTRRVISAGPRAGYDIGIEWDDSEPESLRFLDRFIAVQPPCW
jgi:hypothetical protein